MQPEILQCMPDSEHGISHSAQLVNETDIARLADTGVI